MPYLWIVHCAWEIILGIVAHLQNKSFFVENKVAYVLNIGECISIHYSKMYVNTFT